ncbi:mCG1041451, isoform CRA_a [Mus musculus]|nr:mCG1041451, isoform CRA_a [Mus musculus]EDL05287.1 mCG1041451, isoform CRA_a [Mus musculus]
MDRRLTMPMQMRAVMAEILMRPAQRPSWSHSKCFSCSNSLDPHLRRIKSIPLKTFIFQMKALLHRD